jgi:hypothetical protein
MSAPIPESARYDNPTPDDLAGIPACIEEDHPTIRSRGSQSRKAVRTRGSLGGPSGRRIAEDTPTADDLAGIPISAEGDEDLTVRPSKAKK